MPVMVSTNWTIVVADFVRTTRNLAVEAFANHTSSARMSG